MSRARTPQRARPSSVREAQAQLRPTANQDRRNDVLRQERSRSVDRQALTQKSREFSRNQAQNLQISRAQADRLRNRLDAERPGYNRWFSNDFYSRHNLRPNYNQPGVDWWRGARWANVAGWAPYGWAGAIYYDEEGDPINISPQDSAYAQPTQQPVREPAAQPSASNWLPLGVFALARNLEQTKDTGMFLQLALSRDGTIGGTYYNAAQDRAYSINGQLDPSTQKVVWTSSKPNSPVASTGIYNLTQDSTPVILHFSDGSQQTWTMLRLE
jgi:hypothetical protein